MVETVYSQEIADRICERLADGESLSSICREPGFPGRATVYRWLTHPDHTAFREAYDRARELGCEIEFDRIIEIADSADHVNVQVARLQVDARKWRLAKMMPRKYGDKVALTGGDEGDAPIRQALEVKFV